MGKKAKHARPSRVRPVQRYRLVIVDIGASRPGDRCANTCQKRHGFGTSPVEWKNGAVYDLSALDLWAVISQYQRDPDFACFVFPVEPEADTPELWRML